MNTLNAFRKLGVNGDTIVEVLIAITVISAVLGGAYVSANRSYTTTRQAQERGEALKVTEGHTERLKVAAANPGSGVFSAVGYYCVTDTLTVANISGADLDDFTGAYPPECIQAPQAGVQYFTSIERNTAPPNIHTFTIRTRWNSLGNTAHEEVKITYRIYQ